MTVSTYWNTLLHFFIDPAPKTVRRHSVDRLLSAVADYVMEVNNGRMGLTADNTRLRRLELDPTNPRKPLISGYTGFDGLFVKLVVRLLVEAVLDLFNGFVFVWHSNPPTDANRRGDCDAYTYNYKE